MKVYQMTDDQLQALLDDPSTSERLAFAAEDELERRDYDASDDSAQTNPS